MIDTFDYRSYKACKHLKNRELELPICVPTYGRPESAMSQLWEKYPELPVIFFVRKEQKNLYQPLKNKGAEIVYLKNIDNEGQLGQTRRAICNWALAKGYSDIFMFDDRTKRISVLVPRLSRTGRWNMGTIPELNVVDALRLWEYLIRLYKPDISGCAHSGFTFDISNAGLPPKQYGVDCQVAIHLNVKSLKEHNISYKNTSICGSEDAQINFDILEAKLKYLIFSDLEYDSVASLDSNVGGMAAIEKNTRQERFTEYCRRFYQNICGEGHPGVKIRVDKNSVPYIRFNWNYYRKRNGVLKIEPNYSKYQRL